MILCDYCNKEAALVTGEVIYPHRVDLYNKMFYYCESCQAWVGCHQGTTKALGRLADKELRLWKSKAHAAFDPLWQRKMEKEGCSKSKARGAGYRWLAKELNIEINVCHIGEMSVEYCQRVVNLCNKYQRK